MLREFKIIFLSSLGIQSKKIFKCKQTGVLGIRKFTWKPKRSDKEYFEIGKYAVIYRSRPEEGKIILKKPFNESSTRRFTESEKKLVFAIKNFQKVFDTMSTVAEVFKTGIQPYKAKGPLRGMELKQKKVQKE